MEILNFLNNYYRDQDNFYIGILNRTNKHFYQYKHNIVSMSKYMNTLKYYNKNNKDIYISLNTFNKESDKRTKLNIKDIKSIFFDIDIDADTIKDNIIKELGIPTFVIQTSSNKYQLIYQLKTTMANSNKIKI